MPSWKNWNKASFDDVFKLLFPLFKTIHPRISNFFLPWKPFGNKGIPFLVIIDLQTDFWQFNLEQCHPSKTVVFLICNWTVKIWGCKRWCSKHLRVCAPTLMHSLKRDRLHSYHPAKIPKNWIFPLCTVEKFKFSEFLLDDKNATYLSS